MLSFALGASWGDGVSGESIGMRMRAKERERMAESVSRENRLESFPFVVNIRGMRAGFSEVTELTTGANLADYRERERKNTSQVDFYTWAFVDFYKGPFTVITLKRGYSPDGRKLRGWWKRARDGNTQRLGGKITLVNEVRRPLMVWEFSQVLPTKWVGIDLNAESNDVVIEEMELYVVGLALQS
jgi:phage tail-like protein